MFEWGSQSMDDFPGYQMIDGGEVGLGGAEGKGPETLPNYVTVYFEVDHIGE